MLLVFCGDVVIACGLLLLATIFLSAFKLWKKGSGGASSSSLLPLEDGMMVPTNRETEGVPKKTVDLLEAVVARRLQ